VNSGRPPAVGARFAKLPVVGLLLQLRRTLELLLHHSTSSLRLLYSTSSSSKGAVPDFSEVSLMDDLVDGDGLLSINFADLSWRATHASRSSTRLSLGVPTTVRQLQVWEAESLLRAGYAKASAYLQSSGLAPGWTAPELSSDRLLNLSRSVSDEDPDRSRWRRTTEKERSGKHG
jgi:hypothetical protein